MKTGKNQLRKRAAAFQKLDKILGSQGLLSAWLRAPRVKTLSVPYFPFLSKCKEVWNMFCYVPLPPTDNKTVKELLFLLSSAADEGTLLWNAFILMPNSSVTSISSSHCKITLLLKTIDCCITNQLVAQRQKWFSTITHHSATHMYFRKEYGLPADSQLVLTGS